jgi:pyruvate/2-oxoglutarate dehydrogenase complex dihydrolipoamide dehydrogenase (E3) component
MIMNTERFQNLVIGSGVAGKLISWTLASQGQKTVVVERSMVGGSCPNVACLPSKNVIHSAKAVSLVDPKRGLGVVTGNVRVDMAAVARRKWKMVNELVEIHLAKLKASGAELIMGEARFTEPKIVEVILNAGGKRMLRGDRVFINVGTRARVPNVPGLSDAKPMTHVEALNLERLPEHLVILGGGYVGLEFAQAMRRFGSRVTIVQHSSRLLEKEDLDVSDGLLGLMKDEGIEVLLNAEVQKVTGHSGERVIIQVRASARERTLEASIFSWPPAARRIRTDLLSIEPVLKSTRAATSASTIGCKPPRQMFGPPESLPAALTSLTSARTTSASCSII